MTRAALGGSELSSYFSSSIWALPLSTRPYSCQKFPAIDAPPLARPNFRYIFTSSRAAGPKGWRKHSLNTRPSSTPAGSEHVEAATPEIDQLELPVASSSTPSPIILRDYQESAIDACLSALASGQTRIGVSSPTGSGKTTMFMNLIPRFPSLRPRSRQRHESDESGSVLIVVSSVELAAQAEGAAQKFLPGWTVEVEQSKRSASGIADV